MADEPQSTPGARDATTGRWQKGVSPNPGGRPKAEIRVVELARAATEAAVATLVKVLSMVDEDPKAAVAAANALLDRAWGKPAQRIDATVTPGHLDIDLSHLTDAQLVEYRAATKRALELEARTDSAGESGSRAESDGGSEEGT